MALQIDGFSVLHCISNHPDVFESVRAAAVKAATDLIVKQLKAASFNIENLKKIEAALGNGTFTLIMEQVSDKDLPKILKKVDPNYQDLKTGTATLLRKRFQDLAAGRAEPAVKAPAARAPVSKKKISEGAKPRALSSKSMGTKRRVAG